MAKQSLGEKIRDYILVAVVTVLLWLLAEGRTLKKHTLECEIQFVAPATQELYIEPASPQFVELEVECSDRQFDQLAAQARAEPFRVEVHPEPKNPTQRFDPARVAEAVPAVAGLRVHVLESEPSELTVRVEKLETRRLPVKVNAGGVPVRVEKLEPANVEIRLPASVAKDMVQTAAEVDLTDRDLQAYGENQRVDLGRVPISLPPALSQTVVSIEPATADLTLTVRQLTQSLTLVSVPIHVNAPWSELAHYAVIPEDQKLVVDEDIRKKAPTETIERIESGQQKVWAELQLSAEFLASGVGARHTLPVTLRLPPGVRTEQPPPQVTFTIERKVAVE